MRRDLPIAKIMRACYTGGKIAVAHGYLYTRAGRLRCQASAPRLRLTYIIPLSTTRLLIKRPRHHGILLEDLPDDIGRLLVRELSAKIEHGHPHDLGLWRAIAQSDILLDLVRDRGLWRPERGIEHVALFIILQHQYG
jgi:hypothetical protein